MALAPPAEPAGSLSFGASLLAPTQMSGPHRTPAAWNAVGGGRVTIQSLSLSLCVCGIYIYIHIHTSGKPVGLTLTYAEEYKTNE